MLIVFSIKVRRIFSHHITLLFHNITIPFNSSKIKLGLIYLIPIVSFSLLFSCETLDFQTEHNPDAINKNKLLKSWIPYHMQNKEYTKASSSTNDALNFNSTHAINRIVNIENEYFNAFSNGTSKYYGTEWRSNLDTLYPKYESEIKQKRTKPDSMHCTLYAVTALKAGLGLNMFELDSIHQSIYGNHEHAGWSIGYILVTHYNWKAYHVLWKESPNYKHYLRTFNLRKKYPVWKQPDIPIEKMLIRMEDDDEIDSLLLENQFAWGFSNQGWHTWITRYDTLKECNWNGAPSKQFDLYEEPLFLKTKFLDYFDFDSHILIFPPKKE